ncbi:hypothetical protein F4813DRAFT_387791 [Daldinia decipiens]|uniref:uncharacterized protein n=1 Tax=Daldinia decipiens TaxID=326647 RepID=UPI0020C24A06|nr:uncharacterized protein F4813DRAFT_387791 [Daldinia decipiens]KAI1659078.1 hypothetical protein F4813DRAFT_387791 [Daldinia decipiens]
MSDAAGTMTVNGNFLKDFLVAIAVAAVSTIILLREEWLSPTLEDGYQDQSQPELPLVQSGWQRKEYA